MNRQGRSLPIAAALCVAAACGRHAGSPVEGSHSLERMDRAAERYAKLVLAAGTHDPDLVDAFYGPAAWRAEAQAARRPLGELRGEADALGQEVRRIPVQSDEMMELRRRYVGRQLEAVIARMRILGGERLSFDEESRALYDAVAPTLEDDHFLSLQAELEKELPGEGPLIDRYEAFHNRFLIPREKLDAVFQAAIGGCRERTAPHVDLPAGETFTVEYVTGKTWSAYNWYQGNFRSLIQVNTDLPVSIDRAVDLACHEGYPGHHVYNALLEKHLVRDRGWVEFSVYPLFSPQSLVAEGSANFGIEVAFPGEERVAFERERLYPLAGLDASLAEKYAKVQELVERLNYAGNEAARRYLDGRIDAKAAAAYLVRYGLWPRARAEQRVRFMDQYRSYVINYNLGKDLVRAHIESLGGTPDRPVKRWEEFKKLLASPRLPSGLRGTQGPARPPSAQVPPGERETGGNGRSPDPSPAQELEPDSETQVAAEPEVIVDRSLSAGNSIGNLPVREVLLRADAGLEKEEPAGRNGSREVLAAPQLTGSCEAPASLRNGDA